MTRELDGSKLGDDPAARIEELAQHIGLTMTLRSTLRTWVGSTHWHFSTPGEKGVLEVTWWPQRGRLWLKVHGGRNGPWIMEAVERFVQEFGGSV